MNKKQLAKHLPAKQVRLRPIGRRVDFQTGQELPKIDDRWLVTGVDRANGISLWVQRTGHGFTIPFDSFLEYREDPDDRRAGFLMLKMQITLSGNHVHKEPLIGPPR